MEIANEPIEKIESALKNLNKLEALYRERFGDNSLDGVIYVDPEWFASINYKNAAEKLQKAIRINKPLEQTPKEMWDELIF